MQQGTMFVPAVYHGQSVSLVNFGLVAAWTAPAAAVEKMLAEMIGRLLVESESVVTRAELAQKEDVASFVAVAAEHEGAIDQLQKIQVLAVG